MEAYFTQGQRIDISSNHRVCSRRQLRQQGISQKLNHTIYSRCLVSVRCCRDIRLYFRKGKSKSWQIILHLHHHHSLLLQCDLDGVPEVSLALSTKRGICELTTAAHACVQETVLGQHRVTFSPPANQFTLLNYEVSDETLLQAIQHLVACPIGAFCAGARILPDESTLDMLFDSHHYLCPERKSTSTLSSCSYN